MKTYAFLAFSSLCVASLTACTEDFCDKVQCGTGGTGAATESTSSTEAGPGSTGSSTTQPTSSSGGDGGASGSSGSGDGGGGDGGSGAGGDGSGGAPPQCALEEGQAIDDSCGVFVNSSSTQDQETGSKAAPYKSLSQALAAVGEGATIYVCDANAHYDESIEITGTVALVGGLGCATWSWTSAGRSKWESATGTIPLTVSGGAEVSVSNFEVTAADALVDGASSIAIFAADATLTLANCDIHAGRGGDGAPGDEDATPEPQAENGDAGVPGCDGSTSANVGADGGGNSCPGFGDRSGGPGGNGTNNANGGNANPGSPALDGGGTAGLGEGLGPGGDCSNGGPGAPGEAGEPADGASEENLGQLTLAGFIPAAGRTGTVGTPGSGGGGGGGGGVCAGAGHPGGGGGAGGCGGDVGAPGGGGGASIGIALLEATLAVTSTSISVSDGGRGGDGAAGEPGQVGGQGNLPGGIGACSGASGGTGGQGGSGGGGRGGHAVAILWAGGRGAPNTDDVDFAGGGEPGEGGDGGIGIDAGNVGGPGADGSGVNVLEVDAL